MIFEATFGESYRNTGAAGGWAVWIDIEVMAQWYIRDGVVANNRQSANTYELYSGDAQGH